MRILFLTLCTVACAFTNPQINAIRLLSSRLVLPPLVVVHDVVMKEGFAFTDASRIHVYIDAHKLRCCPNTFHNVVAHELHHTMGAEHTDNTPVMKYAVQTTRDGLVFEDSFKFDM